MILESSVKDKIHNPKIVKSNNVIDSDIKLCKIINSTIKRDFEKNYFKNREQSYVYKCKITNNFKNILESYKKKILMNLHMNKKHLPDTIYNIMWYRSDVIKYTKNSFTTNSRNMNIKYSSLSSFKDNEIKLQFLKSYFRNGERLTSNIPMLDIVINTKDNTLDICLLSTRFSLPL